MEKFICVFNERDMETMLANGFGLLKVDERNSLFVFTVNESVFSSDDIPVDNYVSTNTLTF